MFVSYYLIVNNGDKFLKDLSLKVKMSENSSSTLKPVKMSRNDGNRLLIYTSSYHIEGQTELHHQQKRKNKLITSYLFMESYPFYVTKD
jgi:hypothetical protein